MKKSSSSIRPLIGIVIRTIPGNTNTWDGWCWNAQRFLTYLAGKMFFLIFIWRSRHQDLVVYNHIQNGNYSLFLNVFILFFWFQIGIKNTFFPIERRITIKKDVVPFFENNHAIIKLSFCAEFYSVALGRVLCKRIALENNEFAPYLLCISSVWTWSFCFVVYKLYKVDLIY